MKHLPPPIFGILKTLVFAVFINATSMLHAQNNNTCQTAVLLNPVTTCSNSQSFVFSNGQTEQWYSFNTGSDQFFILDYKVNTASKHHLYSVNLYSGVCNNNMLVQSDTLANYIFLNEIFFENLDSNTQYYIQVNRYGNTGTTDTLDICINTQKISTPGFEACISMYPLSNIFGACCAPEEKSTELCEWEEFPFGCSTTPFSVHSSYGGAGVRVVWTLPGAIITKDWVGNNGSLSVLNYVIPPGTFPNGFNWTVTSVGAEYFKDDGFGIYYPLNKKISIKFSLATPPEIPYFEVQGNEPYCMGEEVCFDFYSSFFETQNTLVTSGFFEPYLPFFINTSSYDASDASGPGLYTETNCYQYLSSGIYTPTATVENGCGTETYTQTLEIGPYPHFEVPEPLCAGQDFTFTNTTACLQYVQSWTWSFGDGNFSTQQNPTHTYTNPGTYLVVLCLIDANGQQNCTDMLVTVHPSPQKPVITGNLFMCDPSGEYCVQNQQPGETYTWNITNGFPTTYTGPCVEVNWSQSGSGFITVITTNQYGCISVTDAEVAECCYKEDINNPGTEINLYNATATYIINNILGGSSTWTTNTYININGYLEIDQNFTFSNCPNIYLGQNAKINVSTGNKLRIDNFSKLEAACPLKMWDGIYLQTYTSQLEADVSTFMHAQNAIVSQNGAKYTVTSSTFNQNWIGLKVEPFAFSHLGTVTASSMGPTNFLCTVPLLYPHTGKRSHAGVYLQKVGNQGASIIVGSDLLFDNQNTGVLAEGSNVLVKGSVFQNMGIVQGQGGGIGVHTKGGELGTVKTTVGGLPANTNSFNNCFTGVLLEHWQEAEISYNNFNGTNNTAVTGIRVQHITKYGQPIPFKNITVKNNNINNYQTGISLYSNMNAKVNVFKNNINQQGVQFGSGIIAQEMPISITFNLTTIKQNTIQASATGIHTSGLNNALIEDNTVSKLKQFPLFNTYGVLLRACNNARVRDNSVSSQNPSSNTKQHGYAFEMSEATFATCNEANKTGTGMRCAGAMPNTQLWGNTFMQNHTGFRLAGNGLIGPQYRNIAGAEWASDNRWMGNHTERSNAAGSTPSASPFYVRQTSGGGIYNPNFSSNNLLSIFSVSGPQFKCAIINNPEINGNPAKKKLLQEIAQAQLNLPQPDTSVWMAQIAAFLTLQQNQQLLADSILQNFYDSILVSNPRTIQAIDSLMFDSASCNNTLLSTCNNINPANIQEQWLKEIAFIYISRKLSGDTFTMPQTQQLQYIASLCPYTDGLAVYQARFILAGTDSSIYENNCELDMNGNGQRVMEKENENINAFIENTEIKVYPNPAIDVINVELPSGAYATIEMYNTLGELVIISVGNTAFTTIDVKNLSLGFYTIRVRTDNLIYNNKIFLFR